MTDVAAVIGNYEGEQVLPSVLESLAGQTHVPTEVLVPTLPESADVIETYLSDVRGAKVRLRVPERGAGPGVSGVRLPD